MADNYIEVLSTPNFRNSIHFAEKNKLGFNPIIITDATIVDDNGTGSRQNIILSQIPTPEGTNRQPIYLLGCGGNQGQKSGIIIASGENGALIWSNMSLINNLGGTRYNPANSEDVILSADGKVLLYSNMNTEAKAHQGFTACRLEFGADGVFRITEQDFPARESDKDVQNWPSQPVSRPFKIQYNVGDNSKTITVVDEYGNSNFENITTKEIIIKGTSASTQAEISITNTDIENKSFPYKVSGATNTTTSLNAIIRDISNRLNLLGFEEGGAITVKLEDQSSINCGYVAKMGQIIYGYFRFEDDITQNQVRYFDSTTSFSSSIITKYPPIQKTEVWYRNIGNEEDRIYIETGGNIQAPMRQALFVPKEETQQFTYPFWYVLDYSFELGGTEYTAHTTFTQGGKQGSSKTIATLTHKEGEEVHIIESTAVYKGTDITDKISFNVTNNTTSSDIIATNTDTDNHYGAETETETETVTVTLTVRYKIY